MRGALQVIEIIPPQVATDLMDGLKNSPFSVTLEKFADDVMVQLIAYPFADEITVDEVKPFRFAEGDGKMTEIVTGMVGDS